MAIDPNATASIENFEQRSAETKQETTEEQKAVAESFRESPEYTTLEEALWEEWKKLLERIVTQFSMNWENIKWAIHETTHIHAKHLWYGLEDPKSLEEKLWQALRISMQEEDNIDIDRLETAERYDETTQSGKIHNRMAERVGEGWAEKVNDKLYTQEGREENFKQANTLFFKEGSEYLKGSFEHSEGDAKENEEWFNQNTKNNWPLEAAFLRIQWNFVIPEIDWYDGSQSLEELQLTEEQSLIINEALADAFLLEIEDVTLDWAINYDAIKVQGLKDKISSPKTNALEKLKAFWEIHTTVNTSKGRNQQAEKFRRRIWKRDELEHQKQELIESIRKQLIDAQSIQEKWMLQKKLDAAEALKAEAEEVSWWDVWVDWDLALEWVSESTKKTA